MSVLTCRMGLYLYSRPISQFFKRSIRLWNDWFDQWIFDFSFNLKLIHNNSSVFHIKKIFWSSLIFWYFSTYTYVYRFILHPFWSFNRRIPLRTQRSQLHSLEQLPLSLCTYPSFIFLISLSEPFFFWKQDLAQDCPFFIPGFLWIWKLSLSRFPYQGSIQSSP